ACTQGEPHPALREPPSERLPDPTARAAHERDPSFERRLPHDECSSACPPHRGGSASRPPAPTGGGAGRTSLSNDRIREGAPRSPTLRHRMPPASTAPNRRSGSRRTAPRAARDPVAELDHIEIRGAREHNLQSIDVDVPKKKLVVMTGVSGSGKSSLAFDTLYAEGQRRYVESLSAYARQFLGQMEKPRYDTIRGLSPTISIEQKTTGNNPRSTVGTITEISDYLRVLYARAGEQYCPGCGKKVEGQSVQQIAKQLAEYGRGARLSILAPLLVNRKGEHRELLERARARGFVRMRVDVEVVKSDGLLALDKRKKHHVEAVVDRVVLGTASHQRLSESVETALGLGGGRSEE